MNKFFSDSEKRDKILQSIYEKIPDLKNTKIIMLPRTYFKMLTDEEFIIFYKMPGLIIKVSARAMQYIEERRIRLKLIKAPMRIEN